MRDVTPLALLLLLLLHLAQSRELLRRNSDSVISISSSRELERAVDSLKNGHVLEFKTGRVRVSTPLAIYERNITIQSRLKSGTTIRCSGSKDRPAFHLYSGDVRFSRVHFEGCNHAPVKIEVQDDDSPVVFDRVKFRRNRSPGLFAQGGALSIVGCASSGCRIAQTFPVSVIIQQCTFTSNSATLGGAVYADNVNLTIIESRFVNNEAGTRGGAVYIKGVRSTLTIEGSGFEGNAISGSGRLLEVTLERGMALEALQYIRFPFADATGGAISVHSIADTRIDDCRFVQNRAPAGGAISTETLFNAKGAHLVPKFRTSIHNSTFQENSAAFASPVSSAIASKALLGGAIYTVSTKQEFHWKVEKCTFEKNAAHDGGAIHIVSHRLSTPSILRSTFLENTASSFGGAVVMRNMGLIDVRECVFEGNGARSGGALFITNNAHCVIRGLAGLPPDPRSGNRTTFTRNRAELGGAIACLACGDFVVQDALFLQNEASREGGGVYVYDTDALMIFLQATFEANRAARGGGAVFDRAASVRLTSAAESLKTVFSHNRARSGSAVAYSATHPKENRFLLGNVQILSNEEPPAETMTQSEGTAQVGGTVDLRLDAVPVFAVTDVLLDNVTVNDNSARFGGGVSIEVTGVWNQKEAYRCPAARFEDDPCRLLRFVDVKIVNNRAIEAPGLFVTEGRSVALVCLNDRQRSPYVTLSTILSNSLQNSNAVDSNCTYIDNNYITGTESEENVTVLDLSE